MSKPPLSIARPLAVLGGACLLLAACGGRDVRDEGPITFQQFEAADVDHDGKLSKAELEAIPELAPYFDRMDTDHSGFLSWTEVRAGRFPVFRMPRPGDKSDGEYR
ncbi:MULTISPECIES: EF-hand domain-containing protein [Hydrocarboniphaga]|jgi:hypothetical protein|uniref:EF-hand domain-containing protein n=1 Tax=Hydrocarboniphaga effusa AP103 TaxID=1172194 RepID=I7ZBA1_9GAMM|nr:MULTISPECIES: EF-hand domain-containing protein [Hydrocarboniphaga]EIT68937.1 hypothetical protein WQQ_25190 [Hydrocarboniphaga effusa AP103]MDZ4081180.1 EF-hand domain-containing protein [Hydrocarboniphaga sp.]